jgi:hypothetical protein
VPGQKRKSAWHASAIGVAIVKGIVFWVLPPAAFIPRRKATGGQNQTPEKRLRKVYESLDIGDICSGMLMLRRLNSQPCGIGCYTRHWNAIELQLCEPGPLW